LQNKAWLLDPGSLNITHPDQCRSHTKSVSKNTTYMNGRRIIRKWGRAYHLGKEELWLLSDFMLGGVNIKLGRGCARLHTGIINQEVTGKYRASFGSYDSLE